MKLRFTLLIIPSIIFFSCQNNKEELDNFQKEKEIVLIQKPMHEGKVLMETNCFTCHNNSTPLTERIAPTFIEIKMAYLKEAESKEEFIENIVNFTDNPSIEIAKLHNAIEKYKLMPYQKYPKDMIEKIADYLYTYQIDVPEWFIVEWQKNNDQKFQQQGIEYVENEQGKNYEKIGLNYALSTKQVLGKNLMGAIQNKGTIYALTFCNEKAIPLTDSMASNHQAFIQRVSDRNRNPNNFANELEIKYIQSFQNEVNNGIENKPKLHTEGNFALVYYPIITNSMCLQCHGKPNENIQPNVLKQISDLYPQDKAINYTENEIRGLWKIIFEK